MSRLVGYLVRPFDVMTGGKFGLTFLAGVDTVAAAETVSVLALQDLYSGNDTNYQQVSNALDVYVSQNQTYGLPYVTI